MARAAARAEKALTRRSDALARWRQARPGVRIDEPCRFETEAGDATLADLVQGRSQWRVYRF